MMRNDREKESLGWVLELIKTKGWEGKESPNQFDHYDIEAVHKDYPKLLIEVKQRLLTKEQFVRYNLEGFMLEGIKYNFLKGRYSLYCNTVNFGDWKVIIFWNINKLKDSDINNGEVITSRTTEFEDQSLIQKRVRYLKVQQASSIHIKDNGGEWFNVTPDELYDKLTEVEF